MTKMTEEALIEMLEAQIMELTRLNLDEVVRQVRKLDIGDAIRGFMLLDRRLYTNDITRPSFPPGPCPTYASIMIDLYKDRGEGNKLSRELVKQLRSELLAVKQWIE